MANKCDNKSVGMLVWRDEKLLLIERKKKPFGFAPPAGHLDGDNSFEQAAKRELKEEVGLDANKIELIIEGRKENPCRREGGTWHYWKIYKIEANGEVKRSEDETKQANFFTKDDLLSLALKTEQYINGRITQEDWEKSPGLEIVWYEWLKKLQII
ncbi:NUDIX hydrolase [Candidatus Falkowbacteria bacterium]|nr:NUDIX hydrolase [Candidatus Falkowbacteria bacterium]NCT54826.1 NUDIX hydrolase [Candidatus Falkowbacteria bacterium]